MLIHKSRIWGGGEYCLNNERYTDWFLKLLKMLLRYPGSLLSNSQLGDYLSLATP